MGVVPLRNPESLGSGTYFLKAVDHDRGCMVINQVVVIVNPALGLAR